MLDSHFRPKGAFDLIRIGRENDGGYLVEKKSIDNAKTLLSFGICDDWSFEKHFLSINRIPLKAYDPTTSRTAFLKNAIFALLQGIIFFWRPLSNIKKTCKYFGIFFDYYYFFRDKNTHKKFSIGYPTESERTRSLQQILDSEKVEGPLFIKCDIEGAEYRILDDIIEHAGKICGLVMEFHNVDYHEAKIISFIKELQKKSLQLVHIHANNNAGHDKIGVPLVIEITFAKKPVQINLRPILPHPLDFPNMRDIPEISLEFAD